MSDVSGIGAAVKRALPAVAVVAALFAGLWMWTKSAPSEIHRFRLFAMGTLVDVQIAGDLNDDEYTQLSAFMNGWLNRFEERWSVLREGSLAEVNKQLRAGSRANFASELGPDFALAQAICQKSGGRFDPAIGRWIKLWGFEREEDAIDRPPSRQQIEANRSASWCDADLQGDTVSLRTPEVRLNFGGMAKGRAVDGLLQVLSERGYTQALVNAGGDLKASGPPPGRNWRIGIRDPRAPAEPRALAAISMQDGEALFSSGDYERYFLFEGQRYHHLLDPNSGYPAHAAISATVLHSDAALADAAATALFVAGPDKAKEVADALGLSHWMVIGNDGRPITSPALEQRLEWLVATDATN